jgi:protein-disulfide isomerase
VACVVVLCALAAPQLDAAAEDEPGITREQADAILEELKAVRGLLEQLVEERQPKPARRRGPGSPVRVSTAGAPALGRQDAPVTVVEFTDYECPFCKRFHQTTFESLKRDYIDTGQVRWVVRDLPLPIHPNARAAAQAAHCAGEQGRFWEMRETLFANAPAASAEVFRKYGADLDLDVEAYVACLNSGRFLDPVDKDAAEANGLRITGTPTFVVGRTEDQWVEGRPIVGAQSYAVFDGAIRLQLREPGGTGD